MKPLKRRRVQFLMIANSCILWSNVHSLIKYQVDALNSQTEDALLSEIESVQKFSDVCAEMGCTEEFDGQCLYKLRLLLQEHEQLNQQVCASFSFVMLPFPAHIQLPCSISYAHFCSLKPETY